MRCVFAYTQPVSEPAFISIGAHGGAEEFTILMRGLKAPHVTSISLNRDQMKEMILALAGEFGVGQEAQS